MKDVFGGDRPCVFGGGTHSVSQPQQGRGGIPSVNKPATNSSDRTKSNGQKK